MHEIVSAARRALVVEDDPHIRSMMVTLLKRSGFDVVPVENGSRAIDMLQQNAFDLLVLDLAMPETSGYEVVAFLKANLPRSLKRIIVTTASSAAINNPFPEEICKLLAKPFDMTEFVTFATFCSDDTATRARRLPAQI